MKKLLFLHIVIFSFSISVFSQTLNETYAHSKALYSNGDYEEAISELRRVFFFAENKDPQTCKLLGDCYRRVLVPDKSLYYYELAFDLFTSDSAKLEMKFQIISLHLQFDQPNYALTQIYSLPDSLSSKYVQQKNFYEALVYYRLKDFNSSKTALLAALNNEDNNLEESIDSLYEKAAKNDDFNVYLPMMLSIIPGLGQLYLGEYKAALNSFLLTGSFAVIYVYSIGNLSILDAVLMVMPWFHRYYQGGLLQAKTLAIKKKENKDIELYNALIDIYASELSFQPE